MEKSFKRECIEFFAHRKQKSEALDKNKQPFLAALCIAWPATIISIPAFIVFFSVYRDINIGFVGALAVWTIIYISDLIICGRCKSILMNEAQQEKEASQKAASEQGHKIKFYKECQANGVTDITDTFDRKKARLIAQRLGCQYSDIEQYYREAETAATQKR
jgi:hypothetical protein